ncbi:hypothetical protein U1Q18_028030, partial [Sarracenia purpurea var. burkii]
VAYRGPSTGFPISTEIQSIPLLGSPSFQLAELSTPSKSSPSLGSPTVLNYCPKASFH